MMKTKIWILIGSMIIGSVAFAQPANDNCSNATSLGTLPAPLPCNGTGTQVGASVTLTNQTNVNATPDSTGIQQLLCQFAQVNYPNDVWYSFVASSYQVTITVSNATFVNPYIAAWGGSCGLLQGLGCVIGAADTASLTFYQTVPGTTYFFQVAGGDPTQNGTFTLKVHNDIDCGNCLITSTVSTTPPPVNGTYAAGQTVQFCFTVTNWQETNTNWFHGMQPSFGSGWDGSTLVPGTPPASVDGQGTWGWYPSGVTSSFNGAQWPAGYYYDSNNPNAHVGGPGNSYGDNCDTTLAPTCTWQFCMSITARQNLNPGADLGAAFNTSADGESGFWFSMACQNDSAKYFYATSSCVSNNILSATICQGTSYALNGQSLTQPGVYIDTLTNHLSCDSIVTLTLTVDSSCVWPGDADANHLVDNNDLLPIGLGYDSIGPVRSVQGIVWQGDVSVDWIDTLPAGTNYKHADCNGDGIIDANDTTAIMQNFGQVHAKTDGSGSPWRSGIPGLKAVLNTDTLYAGDSLTVTFTLGDSTITADNVYGLAFTYNYDAAVVDSAFTAMTIGSSWIGTATDKISIHKIFNRAGQIKAALTRIDHTSRSGSGPIARAVFRINSDGSSASYYRNIGYISDVKAIDNHGAPIAFNSGADTSLIGYTPNGIKEVTREKVYLYPNPSHGYVTISADHPINEIAITNVAGQEVYLRTISSVRTLSVDVSALGEGLYFVQIRTDKATGTAKLSVIR